MQRMQHLELTAPEPAVRTAISAYFAQTRRASDEGWSEHGDTFVVNLDSAFVTGGEQFAAIFVRQEDNSQRALLLVSTSGPIWDWGRNRRNIDRVRNHLASINLVGRHDALEAKPGLDFGVPSRIPWL